MKRARDLGIIVGEHPTGPLNGLTDVAGVQVGQQTIWQDDSIRTGVTAILPHSDNIFQEKVPAAIYVGNGFGKLAGSTQVQELGNLETPIILTNTLSVGTALQALVGYTLRRPGNEHVGSVNAVVGETNDGYLNDIRGVHVTEADVIAALEAAQPGPVAEGCVGAGTGTSCLGFKGGIGTASRRPGTYTVGVLVQSNYGGQLLLNGQSVSPPDIPKSDESEDGSCMIVIATDAPLSSRNLYRLAQRSMLGLARTGSHLANGSGDYAIAFSTAYRVPHSGPSLNPAIALLANQEMNPLFQATVEATQEAVYNSLFMATTTTGHKGHTRHALRLN